MKNEVVLGLIIAGICVVIGFITIVGSMSQQKPTIENKQTSVSNTVSSQSKTLTLTEVEKHNVQTDCYMVIENKVYDFSKFASIMPNHKDISNFCGQDVTELFNEKHSQKTIDKMAQFLLSELKK